MPWQSSMGESMWIVSLKVEARKSVRNFSDGINENI